MGEAATETAFVVHLGVARQSNFLPDVDQEIYGILRPTLRVGSSCRIARNHIQGIEARHRFAAGQDLGHDVDLD